MSIRNPADREVGLVIRFLNVKQCHPIEIYWQRVEVYGVGVMNDANVLQAVNRGRPFNEGSINVRDKERSGQSTVMNGDLAQRADETIHQNRWRQLQE